MNKTCEYCNKNLNNNKLFIAKHCKCALDNSKHDLNEHCSEFESVTTGWAPFWYMGGK